MAKGTFGERLKRERELREVSLQEIAKGTRIAERFLIALEEEQWAKLPGGVFGRGFVRSIARYLGLSEENLLSEYDLARGETVSGLAPKPEERIPSPPKWIPVAVGAALLLLLAGLVVAGRYAWKSYQARRAQKKSSAIVALPSAVETPRPVTAYAAPSSPARNAALDLSVIAEKATHVRVVADGNTLFDADLSVGDTSHFSAEDRLEVTAADASAVLLELNGQRVALAGAPGSSGTIVLTQKDVRQASGGDTQR